MSGLKLVFGAGSFNAGGYFQSVEAVKEMLDVIAQQGVTTLDTAQGYGESEQFIGEAGGADRFVIDTKASGGFDPTGKSLEPDVLYHSAHESIKKLRVKQVDIFYIHAPDDTKPLDSWVPVMDKLHKEGVFKRFGLSNFLPQGVKEVYDFAKSKGYVLPSVYQGNYSPVARLQEKELFPLLRQLNIAFYAYSPIAGGFLTKTREQLEGDALSGRFAKSEMYRDLYLRPSYLDALEEWNVAAQEEGVSKAELAYRWVSHNSALKAEHGDAVIIGARNKEQAIETIQGLKNGPLKPKTLQLIDDVWKKIEHEAPLDNFNSFTKKKRSA